VGLTRTIVARVGGEAIAVGVGWERPVRGDDVGVDYRDAGLQHVGQRVLRRQAEAREARRQRADQEVIDDGVAIDVVQVSTAVQHLAAQLEILESLSARYLAFPAREWDGNSSKPPWAFMNGPELPSDLRFAEGSRASRAMLRTSCPNVTDRIAVLAHARFLSTVKPIAYR